MDGRTIYFSSTATTLYGIFQTGQKLSKMKCCIILVFWATRKSTPPFPWNINDWTVCHSWTACHWLFTPLVVTTTVGVTRRLMFEIWRFVFTPVRTALFEIWGFIFTPNQILKCMYFLILPTVCAFGVIFSFFPHRITTYVVIVPGKY